LKTGEKEGKEGGREGGRKRRKGDERDSPAEEARRE